MTIDTVFKNISKKEINDYTKYWKSISPKTDSEVLRRWLFAYTSIHTTWAGNVRGYNAIKNFDEWIDDKESLGQKLHDSRCGMQNKRQEFIWNFTQDFISNSKEFYQGKEETWIEFRNRLVNRCKGIGMAKVSFTLEMCYPSEAEIVCLDTHMIKLYGMIEKSFTSKKEKVAYEKYEQDWIERSKMLSSSPYIARCIFWDKKQQQSDSRYWSHVLE